MMGQMFKGIIFTIVIALVSSLLVAIFLVPVLAGKFLPLTNRNEKPVRNPVFKFLYGIFQKVISIFTNGYSKLLKLCLNNRLITLVAACAVLVIAFAMIPTMRINLMPGGQSDSVTLNITLPVGTTFEETKKVVLAFENYVNTEIQGAKNITTSIG